MQNRRIDILAVLLAALYFVAANGMVLECAAKWYSTGGQVAIGLHSGPSKDLPVPTLTERTYLPEWSLIIVPCVALPGHTVFYPVSRPVLFHRITSTLPSYTACVSSGLSNRAPPAA
jgi:hypothetical protein